MRDDKEISIHSQTVLKNSSGKKLTGKLTTLDYLFRFLSAYDFASEGSEEIQEENKTIINASVLGLIFEKINGYKDGSFFTPGFITMYMARETIRKAVVQKFNDAKKWSCQNLDDLYNKIDDADEANKIINQLKICDPAVGSGHFLVSALNEIIAVKNDLRILQDRTGRRLKEYSFEVVNDELIVTDENGELFEYNPKNAETQRVQETLFHEKQTLIESCLFGVDINPNSVKICRLRLWIELLKNAYYKSGTEELETLPNIDINIKCGNSLISRFPLDADLKQALGKSKWTIDNYRVAVDAYRRAKDKEQKHEMERLINDIKSNFRSEISQNDPKVKQLRKLDGELFLHTNQVQMFELSKAEKAKWNKKAEKLANEKTKLETQIQEIKNNKIYENAFEWRFEFPEVLDDNGDFIGFDVVIGNPPYIRQEVFSDLKPYLQLNYEIYNGTADLYVYFIERSLSVLRDKGEFVFIVPNKWLRAGYGKNLRPFIKKQAIENILDFGDLPVFEEATTYPLILHLSKNTPKDTFMAINVETLKFENSLKQYAENNKISVLVKGLNDKGWSLNDVKIQKLLMKIFAQGTTLQEYTNGNIFYGIKTGLNEAFVIDEATRSKLIQEDPKSEEIIKPLMAGRDIQRYQKASSDKYLILSRKGIQIENYNAIFEHLKLFKEKLKKKAGGNKWYELQASPTNTNKFDEPKIMYPDIAKKLKFIFDEDGFYSVNTVYNIGTKSMGMLGFLNSRLFLFYFQNISNSIRGGYLRFFTDYMMDVPIAENIESLNEIVEEVQKQKTLNPNSDTTALETQIDQLVYELYGLSEEEIQIVEAGVK
ncbi:MAG: TaqI-like C-terminal specificity domain-containing protein [Salinivirgaceae bacterium]